MATAISEPQVLDIPEFIRSCVERAGGAVEPDGPGSLEALLPAALEAAAGGRSLVSLALAAEALEGRVPAMIGSPFLDALIRHAAGRGTVASSHRPAGRLKRRGLREEVERTLLFSNCRTRYETNEADVMLSATAQFDFKVAFLSEERREKLYVVPVNLFSNQADPVLARSLEEPSVDAEPDPTLPEAPSVPVEAAYATACRALRDIVGRDAERQQVRVAQRFSVEFARISDYYDRVIADLERRHARERRRTEFDAAAGPTAAPGGAGGGNGPARAARSSALAQKVEAARRERERKLRELGETYGIRTRARLASARCLWQPKAFFKVRLDRGSITRTLVLAYDGLLERLELPSCESCGTATTRLRASSTARLLCPACAAEGAGA